MKAIFCCFTLLLIYSVALWLGHGAISACFFERKDDAAVDDHFGGDDQFFHLLLAREGVHCVEHQLFQDHPQATRADFTLTCLARHRAQSLLGEAQFDAVPLELFLILPGQRVLRLSQNFDHRRFVQFMQSAHDRQTPDEFRDQAVPDQILGLNLLKQFRVGSRLMHRADVGMKPHAFLADAPLNHPVKADESAAAYEQDVRRVYEVEFLVRVFTPALRRDVGDRAFEDLKQRLLHAFAGNVACDRGILVLAADLVYLVDVDDALLRALDVAVCRLQQLQDDVFHVLPDVAGFGERRGVDDGERDFEHPREGLREQRLAGSGRADQQDVRFLNLDIAAPLHHLYPLVVLVDGDGQFLLRFFLPDHVFVEEVFDLRRFRKRRARGGGFLLSVIADDLDADVDALVADVNGGACDQLFDFILALTAEATA